MTLIHKITATGLKTRALKTAIPYIALIFLLALPHVLLAAQVSVVNRYSQQAILIEGKIIQGDLERVEKALEKVILNKNYRYLTVYLNSSGGDAYEAMQIGHLLRSLLIQTYVAGYVYYDPKSQYGKAAAQYYSQHPDERARLFKRRKFIRPGTPIPDKYIVRCYSACVLIFYGGVRRDVADNGYFRDDKHIIPVIGLHRPYYDSQYYSSLTIKEAKRAYEKLENAVRTYLSNMGAPNDLIERMLRTASDDIELVRAEEFAYIYEKKEPFFEEWLIAKCGAPTDGKEILKREDYLFYKNITKQKFQKAKDHMKRFIEVYNKYFPTGTEIERYNLISSEIRSHNMRVNLCRDSAVFKHQYKWAMHH